MDEQTLICDLCFTPFKSDLEGMIPLSVFCSERCYTIFHNNEILFATCVFYLRNQN
jgi:YHS domain-containing protein